MLTWTYCKLGTRYCRKYCALSQPRACSQPAMWHWTILLCRSESRERWYARQARFIGFGQRPLLRPALSSRPQPGFALEQVSEKAYSNRSSPFQSIPVTRSVVVTSTCTAKKPTATAYTPLLSLNGINVGMLPDWVRSFRDPCQELNVRPRALLARESLWHS
jgi:hypothetical protein